MSWPQVQSQGQAGWPQQPQQQQQQQQQQPFQTQAFDFQLVPVIEALADAVEGGARDQQVDELVHELASRFQKAEQILNSSGSNATEGVATQKRALEEQRIKLEERRALIAKYKIMVERIYPTDT